MNEFSGIGQWLVDNMLAMIGAVAAVAAAWNSYASNRLLSRQTTAMERSQQRPTPLVSLRAMPVPNQEGWYSLQVQVTNYALIELEVRVASIRRPKGAILLDRATSYPSVNRPFTVADPLPIKSGRQQIDLGIYLTEAIRSPTIGGTELTVHFPPSVSRPFPLWPWSGRSTRMEIELICCWRDSNDVLFSLRHRLTVPTKK